MAPDGQPTHTPSPTSCCRSPPWVSFGVGAYPSGWRHCLSTQARALSPATGTSVGLKHTSKLQHNPSYSEVWHLPPYTCLLHNFQCYIGVRHQSFSLPRDHSNADMQSRGLCLHWFFFFLFYLKWQTFLSLGWLTVPPVTKEWSGNCHWELPGHNGHPPCWPAGNNWGWEEMCVFLFSHLKSWIVAFWDFYCEWNECREINNLNS